MRRIIAVTNRKGGSGKTTTAVNLSACLIEKNRKVLLIDLDDQASASSWLGIRDTDRGLLDVLMGNVDLDTIIRDTDAGISLVPASPLLVGADKALASEVAAEAILAEQIQNLPSKRWDYVIMDCPPSLKIVTLNALTAAQEVLIPVEARIMALEGLIRLLDLIAAVKKRLNKHLRVTGILPCRVDRRLNLSKAVVDQLKEHFPQQLLSTVIRENVRLSEAPSHAQPITLYAPKSTGAEDYRTLAMEIIRQEKQ